jgi:hypothetical protein
MLPSGRADEGNKTGRKKRKANGHAIAVTIGAHQKTLLEPRETVSDKSGESEAICL